MKYALTNGQRGEAKPDLSGECPYCNGRMVAKCGEVKIWHWSHIGRRICDSWWENETEWHRNWKGVFPGDWQERVHIANNGEKHIADVKTDKGWVLEFQYSFLNPEERRARSTFYQNLVWVINGTRRPRYEAQFFKTLNDMNPINSDPMVRPVFLGFSTLLEEWVDTQTPVFFDFGEESPMWCLIPTRPGEMYVYVAAISRADFIEFHREGAVRDFADYIKRLGNIVSNYKCRQDQMLSQSTPRMGGGRPQYSARWARARSRMRF